MVYASLGIAGGSNLVHEGTFVFMIIHQWIRQIFGWLMCEYESLKKANSLG